MRRMLISLTLAAALPLTAMNGAAIAATADRDGDGMPDRWERNHGLRVAVKDARGNPDRDGLTNIQEYRIDRTAAFESQPKDADSDNDGLEDGDEDLDRDGLASEDEFGEGTRALDDDSDDDGVEDGDEDRDRDGLEDEFELGSVDEDADEDGDGTRESADDDDNDGVDDDEEFDPRDADSDDDGIDDADEDEDGDRLDNDREDEFDTEPDEEDTDEDGLDDGDDDSDGDGIDDEVDDRDDDEGLDDDDEDDADVLGVISSYDAESGQLTVLSNAGATIVATVDEDTEIEFESSGNSDDCSEDDEATAADLAPGTEVSELEIDDETGFLAEIELIC